MCSEEHIWAGVQVVCRHSRSTHLSFQDARLQVLGVIFATCSKARIQTKLLQTPRPAFVVVKKFVVELKLVELENVASADLENMGLVDLQKRDLADYLQKLGQ